MTSLKTNCCKGWALTTESQHIEDDKMRNPSPLRAATPITSRGHYDLGESRLVPGLWPSYQPQRPHHPMKNRWVTDRDSNQTSLPRESMSPGDSPLSPQGTDSGLPFPCPSGSHSIKWHVRPAQYYSAMLAEERFFSKNSF